MYLCVQQMRTQQTERACLSPLMRCQSCCGLMTSAGLSPFRQSDGRVQQKPGHRTGHSMNRTRNVFVCSTGRHVGPRNLQTAKTKKTQTQTNQWHCIRRPLTNRSAIGPWPAVYVIWPGRPHSSVAVIKGPEKRRWVDTKRVCCQQVQQQPTK